MSDPAELDDIELDAEDAKLVTLARTARARNAAAEGAAVRDDTGRTYVATSVELPSLTVSALQAAVVIAVASGATGLEAAAIVSSFGQVADRDRAIVADLNAGAPIFLAGTDGVVTAALTPG
jgi:hypothetical protein